jgi:oligopeptide/dipeptide ABC transporter ATP-binding protein
VSDYLLKIDKLTKTYRRTPFFKRFYKSAKPVLSDISFSIYRGETLAIVGESGCGKTTLARCILGLIPCESGRVCYRGMDLLTSPAKVLQKYRSQLQLVFQNATQSLNPRQKIYDCLDEVLFIIHRLEKGKRPIEIKKILDYVRLPASILNRFPHQISGGQRQRVVIARALACKPQLLVADEPTSSLDAPLKWQSMSLLDQLKDELGLTLLLISHDLPLVGQIADRIAVMYQGTIVETGPTPEIINDALHPYTKLLLQSSALKCSGESADSSDEQFFLKKSNSKDHCSYICHCRSVSDFCLTGEPALAKVAQNREVACFEVFENLSQKLRYD